MGERYTHRLNKKFVAILKQLPEFKCQKNELQKNARLLPASTDRLQRTAFGLRFLSDAFADLPSFFPAHRRAHCDNPLRSNGQSQLSSRSVCCPLSRVQILKTRSGQSWWKTLAGGRFFLLMEIVFVLADNFLIGFYDELRCS